MMIRVVVLVSCLTRFLGLRREEKYVIHGDLANSEREDGEFIDQTLSSELQVQGNDSQLLAFDFNFEHKDQTKCISKRVLRQGWRVDPQCCSGAGILDVKCMDGYKLRPSEEKHSCGVGVHSKLGGAGMQPMECIGTKSDTHRRRWRYKNCLPHHRGTCPTGNCCAHGSSCNKCAGKESTANNNECSGRGNRVCIEVTRPVPDPDLERAIQKTNWTNGHGCHVCGAGQNVGDLRECPLCRSSKCKWDWFRLPWNIGWYCSTS
eukprot:TRINITY_DN7002_c0_g2_i1.p1 TRINITY_DN7002_c0_g2~~TRINITY_DN7002_c0_g2_i1.p1  ORF type:complete len:262 (-),score=22.05 TRINITY_DN7002_c0_g2_i1:96-881(-)